MLIAILAVGLAVRLLHLAAVHDAPFVGELAMDSEEYDRWAQEVAAGAWLANEPFFQAPLYPYLLAVLYCAFGRHLVWVYLLQSLLAVVGLYALYRAGQALAGPGEERWGTHLGLTAAGIGALYGPFVFYDVQLLKESLAITLVMILLWRLLAVWNHPRGRGAGLGWLGIGVLAGTLTLLRENALLVLPLIAGLALWPGSAPGVPARRRGAWLLLFAVGVALPLVPVAWHNARAGGGFLPTTFQGGVNFYIGNHPGADGTYQPISPGKQIPYYERREPVRIAELEAGRALAGHEVSRFWLRRSLDWARESPGAFLALQVRKLGLFFEPYERPDAVDYYWMRGRSPVLRLPLLEWAGVLLLGLVGLWQVRRRLRPWVPVLVFTAGWAAATVLFFLFSRYRLPVVPGLLLLAAVPLVGVAEAWRKGRRSAAFALLVLVLVAWGLPRALSPAPRWDLVHYNLGRLHEKAGRAPEAVAAYRQAIAADPEQFLAYLNLGTLLARSGRAQEALPLFRAVTEIEPRYDDGWANRGAAELALGDLASARVSLDRALELNPRNPGALHNRSLVALRQGKEEEARDHNQKLLTLEPDHAAGRRLAERKGW